MVNDLMETVDRRWSITDYMKRPLYLGKRLLSNQKRNDLIILNLAVFLAVAAKVILLVAERVPFNADEAVVALMARHILQGARPVFFYGQAYMGSLDAWLVALGFWIFGEHVWVIRLVQILLYIGTLVTTFWLGKIVFNSRRVGVIGVVLLAIPTVNVTLYTTVSLGGYGEALLLGNLILILGVRMGKLCSEFEIVPWWEWIILGFLGGLGVWAFGLTLIYTLPVAVYIIYELLRATKQSPENSKNKLLAGQGMSLTLIGIILGSAPWWGFAISNGWRELLWELSGGAIAGVEELPYIFQIGKHLVNFFLFGVSVTLGFRPPWSSDWLALPLLPFMLLFWMAVVVYTVRKILMEGKTRIELLLLVSPVLVSLLAFLLTSFGADPSGRYFVPIMIPLALFAADMIIDLRARIGFWAWAFVALLVVYNLWGTVQSANRNPPGLTTQFYGTTQVDHRHMGELITFLKENGEYRGYSNYWVAYPLAFLSAEELIYIPRLPYHLDFRYTERDDRYTPYDKLVSDATRVAFITTRHPELNADIRKRFRESGLDWQEKQIGDYTVFYGLSQLIRPDEIGLTSSQP